MTMPGTIDRMPLLDREKILAKVAEAGLHGYSRIAEELKEESGINVSAQQIQRYAKRYEKEIRERTVASALTRAGLGSRVKFGTRYLVVIFDLGNGSCEALPSAASLEHLKNAIRGAEA